MSKSTALGLEGLELDALTEVVNIGVSRAAVSLREMVGEEVVLTVPAISTVSPSQAAEMIGGARVGQLFAVEQHFAGDVSGRALLIFPEANSLELVRAVAGDSVPAAEIPDLAPEALRETGNVVLQACIGTMANLLNRTLALAVPQLLRGRAQDLFPRTTAGTVLFVYINFSVRGRRIRGYIALLMDLPSMRALKDLIAELIGREGG
ncbi:chemotaxis protein CheX [Phenylobacterium hankyongense]|uniref:Chemotaxis protein CheX n=1 Tax=Phenylobacterium hankyongense TaxID=1813876 RepID=A0A328B259_9CAUL|nr:chemotaxis protein CheX [Phenylobacterium hankyongense]RAK60999.1 chemotaxis protein CheX [Phenylobacterium hankyongense]